MTRYTAGKYIKSEAALHGALSAKFPGINDFDILVSLLRGFDFSYMLILVKRSVDIWSYEAPGPLSKAEIELVIILGIRFQSITDRVLYNQIDIITANTLTG